MGCRMHSAALSAGQPFAQLRDSHWWAPLRWLARIGAWALHRTKGAVRAGQKKDPHLHVWPVHQNRSE